MLNQCEADSEWLSLEEMEDRIKTIPSGILGLEPLHLLQNMLDGKMFVIELQRGKIVDFLKYPSEKLGDVFKLIIYTPPHNEVVGGYTGFTMSVRPSVDKSYVVR